MLIQLIRYVFNNFGRLVKLSLIFSVVITLLVVIGSIPRLKAREIAWADGGTDTLRFLFKDAMPEPTPTPHPDTVRLQEITDDMEQIRAEAEALRHSNTKMEDYIIKLNPGRKEVLDWSKIPYQRYLVELTQRMAYEHGIEPRVIYPIVCYESKYDPLCHTVTSREDSRGLLQVNIFGKKNVNVKKLFDPAYNLDYQLDELSTYNQLGIKKGLKGAELSIFISKYGQRPKWAEWIAVAIRNKYKEYCDAVVKEG